MTVPDCKPHITLHYSIWRLTCPCKYKLPFPALITRHVSLVSSVCEIVIGEEHLFRYHRSRIICLRSMKPATAHFLTARIAAPIIRQKINSPVTEECENRESCILHHSQRNASDSFYVKAKCQATFLHAPTEKYISNNSAKQSDSIYCRRNKLK